MYQRYRKSNIFTSGLNYLSWSHTSLFKFKFWGRVHSLLYLSSLTSFIDWNLLEHETSVFKCIQICPVTALPHPCYAVFEGKGEMSLFTIIKYGIRYMVNGYSAREEISYHHIIGYSFQLAARYLLYAPSHRQDSTYHIFILKNVEYCMEQEIVVYMNALWSNLLYVSLSGNELAGTRFTSSCWLQNVLDRQLRCKGTTPSTNNLLIHCPRQTTEM